VYERAGGVTTLVSRPSVGADPSTYDAAGIEKFFEETLEPAVDPKLPPPSDNHEAVAAHYVAAAPRYGLEFIG
jgi:hypothetical protein